MVISTPISQFVSGQQGVYQLYNIQKKSLTFSEFTEMANSDRYLQAVYYVKVIKLLHYLS